MLAYEHPAGVQYLMMATARTYCHNTDMQTCAETCWHVYMQAHGGKYRHIERHAGIWRYMHQDGVDGKPFSWGRNK